MTLREIATKCEICAYNSDVAGVAAIIRTYPEVLTTPKDISYPGLSGPDKTHSYWVTATLLQTAASKNSPDMLRLLVEHGANINFARSYELGVGRPLEAASSSNSIAAAKWLIEHGAELNYAYAPGHRIFCHALNAAIIGGSATALGASQGNRLAMVQLLVEAGAKLDGLDNTLRTPLDWAILYNQKEIADYLRSKGAVEGHQVPGYHDLVVARRKPPLLEWLYQHLRGEARPLAWLPLIPDEVPVAILMVYDEDYVCLMTDGMSERALKVPAGQERFQHAELVLYVQEPDLDPGTEAEHLQTPEKLWPINWMRRVAQIPFENNSWLGGLWTIISNEEPPQPLSEFTDMTCWLLLAEKAPLERAKFYDGRDVVFYTMMPIHTAERDLALKDGIVALLRKFEEHNIPMHLDPQRPSLA